MQLSDATRKGLSPRRRQEILHIRHHSLYAPADFDLSPFFEIVKPTLAEGFNYKGLTWAPPDTAAPDAAADSAHESDFGERGYT